MNKMEQLVKRKIKILKTNRWWKKPLLTNGTETYISIPIIGVLFKVNAKRSYCTMAYAPSGGEGGRGEALVTMQEWLRSRPCFI